MIIKNVPVKRSADCSEHLTNNHHANQPFIFTVAMGMDEDEAEPDQVQLVGLHVQILRKQFNKDIESDHPRLPQNQRNIFFELLYSNSSFLPNSTAPAYRGSMVKHYLFRVMSHSHHG